MFHPFSYNNSTSKDNKYKNNNLYNIQLKEFGQTPEQIFFKPHPKKYSNKINEIQIQIKQEINNLSNENKKEIVENKNKENNKNEIIILNEEKEKKDIDDKKEGIDIIKNNYNNKLSKSFPVKSDIDYKLKKQYKSTQKYDDKEIITGTILPESNLIVTGNNNGQLNIYYYYSGEISKYFSLFHEIKNINAIDKETIIYSSEYSINTFDISLGKNIWTFYAHDTQINSLYYDSNNKNIISCTKNGIIHVYDFKHRSSIPNISHFLFEENNIISSDYNSENKFFYSLGEEGNINILNIFDNEEIYNYNLNINNNRPNSISANLNNLNQFIIGFEKGFKIYDVRSFDFVEDWTKNLEFKVEKCIIDNNNILIQNEFGLILYDYKERKKIGERILKNKIGFFNFIDDKKGDTKIVYGDQIGNVFYSMN